MLNLKTAGGFVRRLALMAAMILAASALGYLLLVLAYCIPTAGMDAQMRESGLIFAQEGPSPQLMSHENSILDNNTDALMLLTASYPEAGDAWRAAVNAERYSSPGLDPCQTLTDIYNDGGELPATETYTRYWHGYLLLLKPLLLFFDYGNIRSLLTAAQLGLFIWLALRLYGQKKTMLPPLLLAWLFLNPGATMLSLQYSSVLLITIAALLLLLRFSRRWGAQDGRWSYFFCCIGMATGYFDLLTYPIITLGLPLILLLGLFDGERLSDSLRNVLRLSLSWAMGYGMLWAMKWIIGSLVTGDALIYEALATIRYRSAASDGAARLGYAAVLLRQIRASFQISVELPILALALLLPILMLRSRSLRIRALIPYLLVALYPAVWYFAVRNHSYIHYWFTFRSMAVSVCAGAAYVLGFFEDERGRLKIRNANSRQRPEGPGGRGDQK